MASSRCGQTSHAAGPRCNFSKSSEAMHSGLLGGPEATTRPIWNTPFSRRLGPVERALFDVSFSTSAGLGSSRITHSVIQEPFA